MPRPVVWLIWAVLIPLIPFAASAVVGMIENLGDWPPLDELFGRGNFLLTVIALCGTVIKDLLLRTDDPWPRWLLVLLISLASLLALLIAMVYGEVTGRDLANSPDARPYIAGASLVAYGGALITSGAGALLRPGKLASKAAAGGAA